MADVNARKTLCTLVAAAYIDGKLDSAEKALIFKRGRELGIPPQMIDEILDLGSKGSLAVSVPPTQKLKEELLNDLIDIACADGRLEPAENQLLMKFASQLGIGLQDLGQRVRNRMEQRKQPSMAILDDKPATKRTAPPRKPVEHPTVPTWTPPPQFAGMPNQPVGDIEPTKELKPPLPPGPVQLSGPSLLGDDAGTGLGTIMVQLVKQTIVIDGREGAIQYLQHFCGIPERDRAEQMVDDILRANPEIKPGGSKIRIS
jgi:uncharacterized tellurite resistance protein B-like protein